MAVQNDWQLQPLTRRCAVSGEPFDAGQRVVCFFYQDEAGLLQRADVLPEQASAFQPQGLLLGRWERETTDGNDAEKEARKAMLVSAEELFFSLYEGENTPPADDAEEAAELRGLLLQVLALQLERKRILRSEGKPVEGSQPYLHVKSKRTFSLPVRELEPEKLFKVQEQLSALVI